MEIYRATLSFPVSERFGITSQVRRCAVSVSANLAEGYGRFGDRECLPFLYIAQGSLSELRSHLSVAADLGMVPPDRCRDLAARIGEVERMLVALANRMGRRARRPGGTPGSA